MSKRLTALISACLLVSSAFAACGGQSSGGNEGAETTALPGAAETSAADAADDAAETPVSETRDNLPDLDFGGAEVRISCRGDEDTILEITAEEENGDLVNDAVFRRNTAVEERLNVKLTCVPGDSWANYDSTLKKYRSSIQAGDNDYDIIAAWASRVPLLATDGLFLDLNSVKYIDQSMPWWNHIMTDSLSVYGKLFFLTGDIAITELSTMYVFFWNKQLGADYGVDNLYQTVFDKLWTIDKMREIVPPLYADLNGNNEVDSLDQFGAVMKNGSNTCDGLEVAADHSFYLRSDDGGYELNTDYSRLISAGEKVYELFFNTAGVYCPTEYTPEADSMGQAFRGGRLMLYTEWLGTIQEEGLNDMDSDFGILPYPLMREEQQDYRTFVQAATVWCMPVTARDPDMNGAVMEALAAENYRSVIPAYFETAMKIKYSRDNETARILDVMRDGAYLDFGVMYNLSLGNPYYVFRDVLGPGKSDFASYLAKHEAAYQKQLDALLASFE